MGTCSRSPPLTVRQSATLHPDLPTRQAVGDSVFSLSVFPVLLGIRILQMTLALAVALFLAPVLALFLAPALALFLAPALALVLTPALTLDLAPVLVLVVPLVVALVRVLVVALVKALILVLLLIPGTAQAMGMALGSTSLLL